MRFSLVSLCLAALTTATPASKTGLTDQWKDFSNTCTDLTLLNDGRTLGAACTDNQSKGIFSTFELALCVGMNYKTYELDWSYLGKFTNYCGNCTLNGSSLYCTCDGGRSGPHNSSLDLNQNIGNDDGKLRCTWF